MTRMRGGCGQTRSFVNSPKSITVKLNFILKCQTLLSHKYLLSFQRLPCGRSHVAGVLVVEAIPVHEGGEGVRPGEVLQTDPLAGHPQVVAGQLPVGALDPAHLVQLLLNNHLVMKPGGRQLMDHVLWQSHDFRQTIVSTEMVSEKYLTLDSIIGGLCQYLGTHGFHRNVALGHGPIAMECGGHGLGLGHAVWNIGKGEHLRQVVVPDLGRLSLFQAQPKSGISKALLRLNPVALPFPLHFFYFFFYNRLLIIPLKSK